LKRAELHLDSNAIMTTRAALGTDATDRNHAALRILPGAWIVIAVCFNAGLAVVNAHFIVLSPAVVIGCELFVVTGALAIALANYRSQMAPWLLLIGIIILIACWRAMWLEQFDAKYLRDVLLIPVFVMLGMTFDERHLTRVVFLIHIVVVTVLLLEAIDTDTYSSLFKVQDYYIHTRGLEVEDFWNKQSDLYVSATRPDDRLFGFIPFHRLSSIFLEPVSLGNYCIVAVAFVCARFTRLRWPMRWFLLGGAFLAMIGSDGRLAAVTSSAVIVVLCLLHDSQGIAGRSTCPPLLWSCF
jgi:putative polymerase